MLFWNWKSVLIVCETRLEARSIVLHKDKKLKLQNSAPGLQKRADGADQSVLSFLAGANFWEKHAKNC